MSTSLPHALPDRPNLGQLRRQAKELREAARRGDPDAVARFARHFGSAPTAPVTLAAAQLVVARDLSFASWPMLKLAVDARTFDPGIDVVGQMFISASVEGREREAAALLASVPDIARHTMVAAALLGEAERVHERMAADPDAALATDEVRGWPALLYACSSPWHRLDPGRAVGLADVAALLVGAGSSPDTNNGSFSNFRSALKEAVEQNNPGVVQVLLEAGADPNLGRPIGPAAGLRDHRCLELLLAHGAKVMPRTWTVGAAVFADDPGAVSLLLDSLAADAPDQAVREATDSLPDAAADASLEVVAALLDAGADAAAYDGDRDLSAFRRALRAGKADSVALLLRAGATDDSSAVDRFIGACQRADRQTAEHLLAEHPDLRAGMNDEDRTTLVEAAGSASAATVALMLDMGFTPGDRNGFGEQPLHWAAYAGKLDVFRLLLDAGADVNGRDTRFDATPLAFATVGSGERDGSPGQWVEVVQTLIDAGASREGVWVSGKPPSEEVAHLLREYGIAPDDESGSDDDDDAPEEGGTDVEDRPLVVGSGVMADVARHLEAATRDLNLHLFGSLLHPDVHWTGVCTNRGEVLDWYRGLLAEGLDVAVDGVEVDGDGVILGLRVARPSVGVRPAPPQLLYQVFTVVEGAIIDIRTYPDRTSALARHRP
jgi:ankyrin repeat protein